MLHHLLPLIPAHKCYVEAFGGGGSLLFAKNPSKTEIYNDIDSDLVKFLRIFRARGDDFEELKWKSRWTPYSIEEYVEFKHTWRNYEGVERYYRWFAVIRMSFNGTFGQGGCSLSPQRNKARQMRECVDNFEEVADRLRDVQLDNRDWTEVLEKYDTPSTFFYLDPPYLPSTRSSGGYWHDMSEFEHEVLVETLLDIEGKVLLSGYPSKLYERLERRGWSRQDIETTCYSAHRGEGTDTEKLKRTECLWRNYETQLPLFEVQ